MLRFSDIFFLCKKLNMRPGVLVLLFILSIVGCQQKQEVVSSLFDAGVGTGELQAREINEASGLVASAVNRNLFWTHNDSGDKARVFLIDTLGNRVATVYLQNAHNRDWEDIALGPGPVEGKQYLFVGDIGDNDAVYPSKRIYRFEEPVVQPGDTTVSVIDSVEFVMSDGERDTEAFMIDPNTRDWYIFSKRERRINLYVLKYPQMTTGVDTARFVLQMPHRQVVAADISRAGDEVLVKTYDSVFYWKKSGSESIPELLRKKATILPYVPEPQGEAIAFNRTTTGYFTVSEVAKGERAILYFYQKRKP
jgi:hypothetical protein